jgi:hypothetical protein
MPFSRDPGQTFGKLHVHYKEETEEIQLRSAELGFKYQLHFYEDPLAVAEWLREAAAYLEQFRADGDGEGDGQQQVA